MELCHAQNENIFWNGTICTLVGTKTTNYSHTLEVLRPVFISIVIIYGHLSLGSGDDDLPYWGLSGVLDCFPLKVISVWPDSAEYIEHLFCEWQYLYDNCGVINEVLLLSQPLKNTRTLFPEASSSMKTHATTESPIMASRTFQLSWTNVCSLNDYLAYLPLSTWSLDHMDK